jgi:hypothetical protein
MSSRAHNRRAIIRSVPRFGGCRSARKRVSRSRLCEGQFVARVRGRSTMLSVLEAFREGSSTSAYWAG